MIGVRDDQFVVDNDGAFRVTQRSCSAVKAIAVEVWLADDERGIGLTAFRGRVEQQHPVVAVVGDHQPVAVDAEGGNPVTQVRCPCLADAEGGEVRLADDIIGCRAGVHRYFIENQDAAALGIGHQQAVAMYDDVAREPVTVGRGVMNMIRPQEVGIADGGDRRLEVLELEVDEEIVLCNGDRVAAEVRDFQLQLMVMAANPVFHRAERQCVVADICLRPGCIDIRAAEHGPELERIRVHGLGKDKHDVAVGIDTAFR